MLKVKISELQRCLHSCLYQIVRKRGVRWNREGRCIQTIQEVLIGKDGTSTE